MSKRFIGIDLDAGTLRVAMLTRVAGQVVVDFQQACYTDAGQAVQALGNILPADSAFGDRSVAALPGCAGLHRRLRFPFREKGKLAAALPLELAARLPVPLADRLVAFGPARPVEGGFEVDAGCVPQDAVEELLAHFPDPQRSPRRLDLFPFALAPALAGQDGILVLFRSSELFVTLVTEGRVADYRLLPLTGAMEEDVVCDFVLGGIGSLEQRAGGGDLPIWLIGSAIPPALVKRLDDLGRPAVMPAREQFAQPLSAEMAPAALLALAEMNGAKQAALLNFRQGEYAVRGQLQQVRSRLLAAALMLLVVLIGTGSSMYLAYQQKSARENTLKQQMKQVFSQVMPPGTPVVDVALQLEGKLQELQQQVKLFGLGGQGAASALQAISQRIEREITVDLREFHYSSEAVRLSGMTGSFDAVNRIAELLDKDALFTRVEISHAKLAADNQQVVFELSLTLAGGGQ